MKNKVRVIASPTQVDVAPNPNPEAPYEKTHDLAQLGLVITVVREGMGSGVVAMANKYEAAASFLCSGLGTSTSDFYDVLGFGEEKKNVIFTILRLSKWREFREELSTRLNTSRVTKGISAIIKIGALGGISTYKFLSNQRFEPVKEENPMPQSNIKYDTIFAIVNDGFTDVVMTAARAAGARGGTIITARGTGNKEIEKFYGVRITPEKQIVMIMVERSIKEAVLEGVNNAVGFATKGQGIVFSIPTSDVLGMAGTEQEVEPEVAK